MVRKIILWAEELPIDLGFQVSPTEHDASLDRECADILEPWNRMEALLAADKRFHQVIASPDNETSRFEAQFMKPISSSLARIS